MITLLSWGFKFGRPPANFTFDVSYFKNPWREKSLRNGKKKDILKFMEDQEEFKSITEIIGMLIISYANFFPGENMVFAFCCSAGEYRSPCVLEKVSSMLKKRKITHKIIKASNSKI
jgi:RNase adaptor protein for sRNA GlmZ degradation